MSAIALGVAVPPYTLGQVPDRSQVVYLCHLQESFDCDKVSSIRPSSSLGSSNWTNNWSNFGLKLVSTIFSLRSCSFSIFFFISGAVGLRSGDFFKDRCRFLLLFWQKVQDKHLKFGHRDLTKNAFV